MDQKDLSLYLEEQRTELMSLNKGIDKLSGLVQKQIDTYQPPVSDVKVEGNVKVNTEKAVEVTNLEELQKWLGNLGETVTEAIETNKPEQVTEITVKNIADAQQPDIKVTNFKDLSKFFDQLNDNIANLPQPYVNVEKQDIVFPTSANAPISVRLSDGKSFYNAITAYADANRVDTQGIIDAVNNISAGGGGDGAILDGVNPATKATVLDIGVQLTSNDHGLVTNTVMHGLTTGGGGGYRDVKVNPSGALTVEATIDGTVTAFAKSTEQYAINDSEATATYKYFGFQKSDGAWYIMRKTIATKKFEYVKGASAYSTAWTNRASQTYTDYATAF